MTKEQKVIRGKIGLPELAKQLGNNPEPRLERDKEKWEPVFRSHPALT